MARVSAAGQEIRQNLEILADRLTIEQFEARPELLARYGRGGRARCLEDARFHVSFLAAAADAGSEDLFLDYIAWTKTVLVSRRIPPDDLRENLRLLAAVVSREVPNAAAVAVPFIEHAVERFDEMPADVPSFISGESTTGAIAAAYLDNLLKGDTQGAIVVVADALVHSDVPSVCTEVLQIAQQEVGRLWQLDQISVATEHYCSGVTQQVVEHICTPRRASLADTGKRIVTMCAPGELHDIGLRIVTQALQLEQWNVMPLGANVPAKSAIEFCVGRKPDVLVISATLPPHIAGVAEVVQLAHERPELGKMKIVVGGRAFAKHPEIVQFTGADAYADTPAAVVSVIRGM